MPEMKLTPGEDTRNPTPLPPALSTILVTVGTIAGSLLVALTSILESGTVPDGSRWSVYLGAAVIVLGAILAAVRYVTSRHNVEQAHAAGAYSVARADALAGAPIGEDTHREASDADRP